MMRTAFAALFLFAFAQQPQPAADALVRTETARIVAAASAWTAGFEHGLSGLLFREQYLQKAEGASPARKGTISRIVHRRELLLEANVFLVRPSANGDFVLFRDVYSKNGEAAVNHTTRLQELLTDGTAKAFEQAKRLTDASAEHNLGQINRNVNIPTMALRFLEPARIGGVQFYRAGDEVIDGIGTAIIDFEEVGTPTLVRGANDTSVPARGRYWVDPVSGAVLRAQVEFEGPDVAGRLEIDLMRHKEVAAWVPRAMTEYWRTQGQRITGLATYDRYQRLVVSTGEIVK